MADYQGDYSGNATNLNLTSTTGRYTDVYAQVWNVENGTLGTTWSASLVDSANIYKRTPGDVVVSYTGFGGDQGVIHLLQQIDEWVQSWQKQKQTQRANEAQSSAGFLGVLLLVALVVIVGKGK